ncbi:MAG: TIGR01777 family oxidoreductase [Cyclobacteriaceae bacterium]
MANILITGGTGLVGTKLSMQLANQGHVITHLSRKPEHGAQFKQYSWNLSDKTIDSAAFENIDTIIHLAGAGVADSKWTDQRKKVILDSRVESTKLLFDKVKEHGVALKSYITASAIGIYGSDTEQLFVEDDHSANDFLARVVVAWEDSADVFNEITQVSKVRIGIVLAKEGGALKEIAKPIKLFAGAPLGSGNQWMSWIHIDDLAGIFQYIVQENLTGVYNAVAPHPVTNETLTKAAAKALKKPLILPNVPEFVMKLMLGEMSQIVLEGAKVSSEKIEKAGFQFKFKKIDNAVKDLLAN